MENDNYKVKLLHKNVLDNEYVSFDFEKPKGYSFVEGQYSIFKLLNKEVEGKDFRIFSIASTNDEPYIRIATRIPAKHSDYKDCLMNLSEGEEISMTSPKGKFILDPTRTAVFIAGGIGITPIRSMILSKAKKSSCEKDELIYSELESCYPYHDELEHVAGLHIDYAADIEPTQQVISANVQKYGNEAVYYISGSPGFVKGISGLLKDNGILSENIRHDLFVGY